MAQARGGLHAQTVMTIFFCRLPWQEVLQKCHAVITPVGSNVDFGAFIPRSAETEMRACRPCVAVGFRVGVLFAGLFILIGLVPLNIAGSFLVELTGLQSAIDHPVVEFVIESEGRFMLRVARVCLVAAVAAGLRGYRNTVCGSARRESIVVTRSRLDTDLIRCRCHGTCNDVDNAMQGIGAEYHGRRALQYFDATRL